MKIKIAACCIQHQDSFDSHKLPAAVAALPFKITLKQPRT